ncbi:hypothetical protein AB0M43_19725 [Longispora sp. NPDC051575]|uniref:hypothetical protein n=1 Tax=Longispora sp. NPDC051575 TaxID=3154943 RepID=UPI003420D30D
MAPDSAPPVTEPAVDAPETEPTPAPQPKGFRRLLRGRPVHWWVLEALVGFGAALVLPLSVRHLNVNPLDRIGQVSALATLQFRFALVALVMVAALLLTLKVRGSRFFAPALRLCCAGVAGLASGFVAGGAVVALLGTPWPMFGLNGDSGRIVEWAAVVAKGLPSPSPVYPPLPLYILGYYAEWFHGGNTAYAFKDLQILGAAVTGPLAYLAWRLLLRPLPALAFGVLPAFSLIDAYKPYSQIVLILLAPVLAAMVRALSRSHLAGWRVLLAQGAAFGVGLGVLFLTYSGWFIWSAAGVLAACAMFFPWKKAPWKGLAFLGTTGLAFALVAGRYVLTMLHESATTADRNFAFDTKTDPTYFLMWRTDMPGKVGQWPLPGELGGVGLFSILLFVCLGVCLWLGLRKPMVVTIVCMFASAWVARMWFASRMFETGTVQLWLRTNNQLLYCGLILCGLAVYLVARRFRDRGAFPDPTKAAIGGFVGLLLLFGSVSSSMSDRYMPTKENTYRILPWVSHTVREYNGNCPRYAPNHECSKDGDQTWQKLLE